MKNLTPGVDYFGPPKYLSQRDAPLEIPADVVKKLFAAMDLDMDDKISLEERSNYIRVSEVPIPQDLVVAMFDEAASKR